MKTVLLIEDNINLRENTCEMLEMAGYEVTVAENGKKGLVLAAKLIPDIILCDILMKDGDGYQVIDGLRSDPLTYSIPFVFITAKAEKKDIEEGLAMGANAYIRKPFEAEQLFEIMAQCLKDSTPI